MRTGLFAVLVLSCVATNAQVYRCPQVYPGKDAPVAPLTGASIRLGELHGNGWLVGDDEAAKEGYNDHYELLVDKQAWLVCSYGGTKRIKGRFHDGHEWNQRMEWGGIDWWMRLAPKIGACTVKTREIKQRNGDKSAWTVTAVCE